MFFLVLFSIVFKTIDLFIIFIGVVRLYSELNFKVWIQLYAEINIYLI